MTETDYAYIAGLVDGDGSFDLAIFRRTSTYKGKMYHSLGCSPLLKIGLKNHRIDIGVMNWLESIAGHSIIKETNRFYIWQVRGIELKDFVEKLLPYLKVKREHALITLETVRLLKAKTGKLWKKAEVEKLAELQDRMFATRFHNRGKLIKWDGKKILQMFETLSLERTKKELTALASEVPSTAA